MKKRILSLLLALVIVCVLFPVNRANAAISTSTYQTKINQFINDSRWKKGLAWGDNQTPKLSTYQSWGCCAYAADFVAYVYGSSSLAWNTSSFTKYTSMDDIRAGDIIHIKENHWFVVLSRSGNTLYTAEGNFDDKTHVGTDHWGIKSGKLYNLPANAVRNFDYGYHYKFADVDTPNNVSFADYPDKQSIGSTDAVIATKMYKDAGTTISTYGARLYDSHGNQIGAVSDKSSGYTSNTYTYFWFTLSSSMGLTLKSGHQYQYEFFAVIDGKTYTSPRKTFTTTGTATYGVTCDYNYSGKNYLYGSDFLGTLDTSRWISRDTAIYTLSTDSSVKHDSRYNSLKIVGKSAGSNGHDLELKTLTQGNQKNNDSIGDKKSMTLSFWAKSSVSGAKMYFRWGYQTTYVSVTLSTDWQFYTVSLTKDPAICGSSIHPYIDKAGTFWLTEIQLEDGNTATEFVPEKGGTTIVNVSGTGTYSTLPTPTRSGYSFDGWFTAAGGGTQVKNTDKVAPGHRTLYAHWTKLHIHSYAKAVTAPTCTQRGYTTYTCDCGDSYAADYVDPLGHNYTYTVTSAPTESAAGALDGTCARCGETENVTLPKLNAADYTYELTKEATCIGDGAATYTWNNTDYGDYSFDAVIPKTGHSYVHAVIAPSCTERGFTVHTCTVCGDVAMDSYVAALGHAYEKTGHKDPTATVDGYDEFTCTRCGDSYRETISATGKPGYPFVDMPKEGNWARPGVEYVIDNGLMGGTDATHFEPASNVDRAMLVTILWRAAGSPQVEYKGNFSDVKTGKYYTTAVAWAAELQIVRGDSNGRFNPADPVTRQDLANVLFYYAKAMGVDTSARYNLGNFSDGKEISGYAKEAMSWLVAMDIIRGADGKITPKDTATRAQFALILMNLIEGTK